MAATDLKDNISQNAQGPKRASGDSGSVDQHSLADQIAADKYLAGKDAVTATNSGLGIRMFKISPPGTA